MSAATRRSMCGRWILTTTSRPSWRRAAWTCAIDAEASGCAIELGEELVGAGAQLDGERALDVGVGERLDAIERLLELAAVGVGEEARATRR